MSTYHNVIYTSEQLGPFQQYLPIPSPLFQGERFGDIANGKSNNWLMHKHTTTYIRASCCSRRHVNLADENITFAILMKVEESLLRHDCIREMLCAIRSEWCARERTHTAHYTFLYLYFLLSLCCVFAPLHLATLPQCIMCDLADLDLSQPVSECTKWRSHAHAWALRTASHFLSSSRSSDALAFTICAKEMQFTNSIFFAVDAPHISFAESVFRSLILIVFSVVVDVVVVRTNFDFAGTWTNQRVVNMKNANPTVTTTWNQSYDRSARDTTRN